MIGNPSGDVTLVEFFDYNCGYCKRALEDVAKLVDGRPQAARRAEGFPVLGAGSIEAAEIATALRLQFKPREILRIPSQAAETRGAVGKAQAMAVAKEFGADMASSRRTRRAPQIRGALKEAAELADSLNLTGTPSWVMGKEVIVGAVGYQQLKSKIDNTRKCGKTVC